MVTMTEKSENLSELAGEINATLVKVGHAEWRREFNSRLWACNRDHAFSLITEYRRILEDIMDHGISERAMSDIAHIR